MKNPLGSKPLNFTSTKKESEIRLYSLSKRSNFLAKAQHSWWKVIAGLQSTFRRLKNWEGFTVFSFNFSLQEFVSHLETRVSAKRAINIGWFRTDLMRIRHKFLNNLVAIPFSEKWPGRRGQTKFAEFRNHLHQLITKRYNRSFYLTPNQPHF